MHLVPTEIFQSINLQKFKLIN